MAKMGSFDISEFIKLRDNINRMNDPKVKDKFMKECVQEIAMEVLRRVIKGTAVGATIRILTDVVDDYGNKVKYKSGKNIGKIKQKSEVIHTGGTLRRGWIAKTQKEAEASSLQRPQENEIKEYVLKLNVQKVGSSYIAWIINPVEYASYYEYGHRQMPGRYVPAIGKRLKKSWVDGKFILRISMKDVEAKLPQFLEAKMQEYINQVFGG